MVLENYATQDVAGHARGYPMPQPHAPHPRIFLSAHLAARSPAALVPRADTRQRHLPSTRRRRPAHLRSAAVLADPQTLPAAHGPSPRTNHHPHPRPRPRSSTPGLRLRAYALKCRPPPRILRIQPPCSRPRSRPDSIPSRQHRLGCGWRRLDVSTSPDVARGSSSPTRTLNSVGATFQARGQRKGVDGGRACWMT